MGSQHDETTAQRTVVATYRLKASREDHFRATLATHEQVLRELGLIEATPTILLRREDEQGRVSFMEIFTWTPGGVGTAHAHPEVGAVWDNMVLDLEAHGELPPMAFPHYRRVTD